MNCRRCGAPLKVEEGQNFFHCGYCDCFEFPDPDLDGVALLDEISPYPCPICNKPLVSAIVNEVRIFSCPKCRGNLIDQSKMLPIIRQSKSLDSINEGLPSPLKRSELTRTASCPACHKTYPYGGPGNIIIQGCEHCRLIWLDFGELSRIIRSYLQMYNQSTEEPGAKKKWVAF
jgi:Zn-finger nucleic acid-binding protein